MNDQIDELRAEIEQEKIARDIIGIADTADEIEKKKKYWLLAMENHPSYTFFRNGTANNKDSVTVYNEAGYFKW